MSDSPESKKIKARLMADVSARGAAAVAKDIGVPRGTLGSYLIGTARLGTVLLIETKMGGRS